MSRTTSSDGSAATSGEATAAMPVAETAPFRLPDAPSERQLLGKYFRAFGDPTRLHILELLRDRELSVKEIVERVGTSQPRTSAHLSCLRWCGFVETRRDHRTVYYRLADERVANMLDLGQSLLADNAEHVAKCRTIDGA
ncbi:MAG: ArsR/SmtB family transcription factor [Solirubrobacteraceae bacterium]